MVNKPKRIIVALSGGVDSSVAAVELVKGGYDVIAVTLRLWSDPGIENLCCTTESIDLARRVAENLDIPFHIIDARKTFRDIVVEDFIGSHKRGETPNPCVICNHLVRWDILLTVANDLGASQIATGHYALIQKGVKGRFQLLKGHDKTKDQSYVLHGLRQEALSKTVFPLGNYKKSEVRKIARQLDLPVADRHDSQDLCFVGNRGYKEFLIRYAPEVVHPGSILSVDGKLLGEHQGLAFYTIGQRKGIMIPSSEPYYVVDKDINKNALVVGTKADLGMNELTAVKVNWISGETPKEPFQAMIKIRYKAQEIKGLVTPLESENVHIKFENPIIDITPGQAAVFYHDEICLGGGRITSTLGATNG